MNLQRAEDGGLGLRHARELPDVQLAPHQHPCRLHHALRPLPIVWCGEARVSGLVAIASSESQNLCTRIPEISGSFGMCSLPPMCNQAACATPFAPLLLCGTQPSGILVD